MAKPRMYLDYVLSYLYYKADCQVLFVQKNRMARKRE